MQDKIKQGSITITENVTGGTVFTIVNDAPNIGEVQIDFVASLIQFNAADTGTEVTVDYDGRGSVYSIENVVKLVNNSGYLSKSVAGGSDVALTAAEALNFTIELTGLITGNINVTVPDASGKWLIVNSTTGAFTVTFKTAGGTGFVLSANENFSYSDGTNMRRFEKPDADFLSKSVAGGSDVALTVSEAENLTIELTGLITADINLTVPDAEGRWIIVNSTTGLFKITFKTVSGTGIVLEQNATGYFYSDGTNMRDFNSMRGRRNYIINGETEIAQELTKNGTITDVADNEFLGDNWRYNKVGLGLVDFDHDDSDLPPNQITAHVLKLTVNTLDASVLVADKHLISAFVHAPSMDYHNAKLISTGIYIKANHTARYYVSLRNDGEDRSYVYPIDITAAEGWKEIKTPLLSDKTGTWLRTRGSIGMRVSIVIRAGSNFHGTANQWNAANDLADSDITNFFASGTNTIAFTQVRLQQGLNDGPFEMVEESDNLDRCKDRYEKSYDDDVAPGTADFDGAFTMRAAGTTIEFPLQYEVEKIKTPIITIFNPDSGATGEMRNHSTGQDVTGATANSIGKKIYFSLGSTNVADTNRICHHHVIDSRFKT